MGSKSLELIFQRLEFFLCVPKATLFLRNEPFQILFVSCLIEFSQITVQELSNSLFADAWSVLRRLNCKHQTKYTSCISAAAADEIAILFFISQLVKHLLA